MKDTPPMQPVNTCDDFKTGNKTNPTFPRELRNPSNVPDNLTKKTGPTYHFTSSIQDMSNGDTLQTCILDTPVMVTF